MADERWTAEVPADSVAREDLLPHAGPTPGKPGRGDKAVPLHHRLTELQQHGRRAAGIVTTWSLVSAVIVVGLMLYGGVQLAKTIAMDGIDPLLPFGSGPPLLDLVFAFQFLLFAGVGIWLFVLAVLTLINAPGLYNRRREETLQELHTSSIGLVVADDELWQRIPARLRRSWMGVFIARHHYPGLNLHLLFCACHWESLSRIARCERELNRFQFAQCQQAYNQLKLFYRPKPWQVLLMIVAAIVLLLHLLFILTIMFATYGLRYINAYARLAALCEFFIGDYES